MNELFLALVVIIYIIVIAAMCWSSANHFPKDDNMKHFLRKNTRYYNQRSNHDTKDD